MRTQPSHHPPAPPSSYRHRSHSLTSVQLRPPSRKRASKPPSLSCSFVPPSCSYCFSFESTVAQLCSIVAGAISVPPVIPSAKVMGSSGLNPLKLSVACGFFQLNYGWTNKSVNQFKNQDFRRLLSTSKMWALRCLPLRNRVLRASYSKSISATWVEDDFGTSKRVLTRDEDFKSNFRLPVSDLSPSHMNRALRASCFKFYRSWHASLNFTMTRRQFSGSTTDQDESSDDESDKMDKGVEEGKIPVYIPWKSAALFKMSNSDKRKGKQKMTSNNKIKKVKLTRLAESLEPITSNSTTTPSATTANTLSSLHASSNVETSQRKLKLDLAGEGFLPSLTAAHAISDIIKGHYSQPWPSWKKIPDATRKFWWEKFKSKHQFFPPDLYWARKNFERRGVALLKNLLGKARASRVKPQWIEDGVWDALCAYWNTDTGFLQKSTQGKSNRASGCSGFGAALHTAGPISVTQHKTNMKISLKRIPTQLELFAKTHKHKDETWVDKKSKHVAVISNKEVEKSHNTTMQLSVAVVNLQSQNFTIRDLDRARLRVASCHSHQFSKMAG
ncbi:hypothetical protein AHAS_Ahas16G0067900 [Arachis hypogaea]